MKTRQDKNFKERRRNNNALKQAIRYFDNDLRQEYILRRKEALEGLK